MSLVASGATTLATASGNQVYGQTATSGANMLIYPWAVADTSATGNGMRLRHLRRHQRRTALNFTTDGVTNALTTTTTCS